MKTSIEKEDYLETIYEIGQRSGLVRVTDIARALHLKLPSVTQMMQRLHKEGFVFYKVYAPLELTKKGLKVARLIAQRHAVLHEFFSVLAIPETIQKKDIHGIEHYLSPITLARLKEASQFLKNRKFKPIK